VRHRRPGAMEEPVGPPPTSISERMKALEQAAQPAIVTSSVQIDVDVGIEQRRAEMDASWKTQFEKVSIGEMKFDMDALMGAFTSVTTPEDMMAQFLAEVTKAKAELRQEFEAKAAESAAAAATAMQAKEEELLAVRQELADAKATATAAPAAAPEPEPVAAEADAFTFDLGIGEAMKSIDANIMGVPSTALGAEAFAGQAELDRTSTELEAAQEELAVLREECRAEKTRADSAEAEVQTLHIQLETQQVEAVGREATMKRQAEQWVEAQQQQVIEQAEAQLKLMQQGFEEQLAAAVSTATAAAAAAAASEPEDPNERRIDPSDGRPYTKLEFEAAYGGTDEWTVARKAPDPKEAVLVYLRTLQVTGAHADRVIEALENTYGAEPSGWITELKTMMADGSLPEFLKACSDSSAAAASATTSAAPAEGVPPPTRSEDALPVKSAEWWASKRGRMMVQYTPSAQWAAYGAIPASKGQMITVRSKDDENWWMVTVAGVQGTVPASMIEVVKDEETITSLRQVNTSAVTKTAPLASVPYHGRVGPVKSGFLHKSSAGKKEAWGQEKAKKKEDWKERFFVLHAAAEPWLGYYKDEPEFLSGKKPKGIINIRTAQAQRVGDESSTSFLVATKDRNLKVRCDTGDTQGWLDAVNELAQEARARDARVF
jgi:hypothetical protein